VIPDPARHDAMHVSLAMLLVDKTVRVRARFLDATSLLTAPTEAAVAHPGRGPIRATRSRCAA